MPCWHHALCTICNAFISINAYVLEMSIFILLSIIFFPNRLAEKRRRGIMQQAWKLSIWRILNLWRRACHATLRRHLSLKVSCNWWSVMRSTFIGYNPRVVVCRNKLRVCRSTISFISSTSDWRRLSSGTSDSVKTLSMRRSWPMARQSSEFQFGYYVKK